MDEFCLEVSGDFACFTRPEMKVERVSYDVITPSATRAIFEAILWKPAIKWQVTRIEVLRLIRWINIRCNEVASKISNSNVKQVMNGSNKELRIFIEDVRQQRSGLILRDVAYRLHAKLILQDENTFAKFAEMFKRRARKGQCFNQPYFGTREFAARWRLVESLDGEPEAIHLEQDRPLGWMLYDLDYSDPSAPKPLFFNPILSTNGTIEVPNQSSQEVRA